MEEKELLNNNYIKQEPLSPGSSSSHVEVSMPCLSGPAFPRNDMLAMQQTYHQGDDYKVRDGVQEVLAYNDTSSPYTGRNDVITAGVNYVTENGVNFVVPSSFSSNQMFSMNDRGIGSYSYPQMQLKGNQNEIIQGNPLKIVPPKRNTALPGMGKRSHLPKRYKCAMCAYRTRYKSDLNRHVRKHAVATFNCDICNMPFKTIGNVEFHKRKEHGSAPIEPKKLPTPTSLSMKHQCQHCSYGTMYSSDLTRHMRKHYVAKFHCTVCNRPFMTSGSLVHHKRTAHSNTDGGPSFPNMNGEPSAEEEIMFESLDEEEEKREEAIALDAGKDPVNSEMNQNNQAGNEETVFIEEDDIADNSVDGNEEKDIRSSTDLIPEQVEGNTNKENNDINTDNNKVVGDSAAVGDSSVKHNCELCNKSFGRKLVLDYHLKNIHKVNRGDDNGMYVEYPDDYDLALDLSIQELETSTSDNTPCKVMDASSGAAKYRHQCEFCAYSTNYKSTYDRHVKKHELECHICNVCRMPFITYGHLQRHIRENHPEHSQCFSEKTITGNKHYDTHMNEVQTLTSTGQSFQSDPQVSVGSMQFVSTGSAKPSIVNLPPNIVRKRSVKSEKQTLPTNNENMFMFANRYRQTPALKEHYNSENAMDVSFENEQVVSQPPSTGRYAKLVSDFEEFARKPFACALCFYRTNDTNELLKHVDNHVTGCNTKPIAETAIFSMNKIYCPPLLPAFSMSSSERVSDLTTQANRNMTNQHKDGSDCDDDLKPNDVSFVSVKGTSAETGKDVTTNNNIMKDDASDRSTEQKCSPFLGKRQDRMMIPTFSVHYRKDKTNKTRPYLCLLCRKRFRQLTILKQHFRQMHNDFELGNCRSFACKHCTSVFNNPMLLQEHNDLNH